MRAIIVLCSVLVLLVPTTQAIGQQAVKQAPETSPGANLLGRSAPDFVVATLDGRRVSLADYRGKALLVNFWATWCGNCKLEMPWLAELRQQYKAQSFEVLGILTNDASPEKIAVLTQKYGVTYPILMCNHKTAQAYGGLPELPESFFINRRGKVVAEMTGADSKAEIEVKIQQTLGAK